MRRRRPAALGFVLATSFAAVTGVWSYMKAVARDAFEGDILKVKQSFYEGVKAAESSIQSLESFSEAIGTIDQERFGRFAGDLMAKQPFLTSAAFYEHVSQSQRDAYEERLRVAGLGDGIVEGGAADHPDIGKATERLDYFPITAVDAGAKQSSYFGWDVLSDPSRSSALRRAVDSGATVATPSFLLDNGNVAIEVYAPVRSRDTGGQAPVIGVVGATFDLTRLLGEARWREGVTIVLSTVLSGDQGFKDIYRSLDREPPRWPRVGSLESRIEIERFGQRLGLRFEKQLFPGRVNFSLLWVALGGCGVLAILAFYLVRTYERLEVSHKKLAEANATLERKVEERTRELVDAHAEIKEILDNLDDVVITVEPDLTVGRTFSASSKRVLGIGEIAGAGLKSLLFKDLDIHEQEASRHMFALDMLSSFDQFQWSISSDELLKVITFRMPNGAGERTLSLRYSPVFDGDTLRKVVVVAADITEILALRASLAAREKESTLRDSIISELAAADKAAVHGFFAEMDERLDVVKAFAAAPSQTTIADVMRPLHTLKGSARAVGLRALARVVHEAEDSLAPREMDQATTDEAESDAERIDLGALVGDAIATCGEYRRVFTDVFASSSAPGGNAKVMGRLRSLLESGKTDRRELVHWLDAVKANQAVSVADLFEAFRPSVCELSTQLQKQVELEIPLWDLYVDAALKGVINETFIHGLRNAIDHGIELPEERAQAGKPLPGRLWLEFARHGSDVTLMLCDDGRGVDLKRLHMLATERGLVSVPQAEMKDDEILDLLFAPGFSTKQTVTDVSGRGVGLDAVRASLSKMGGTCRILSVFGKGARFEVSIPSKLVRFLATTDHGLAAVA
jgi:HPt (histidine-containing phosphotransfer) domain-containing protein/CHASE1-domain containing sensor protein